MIFFFKINKNTKKKKKKKKKKKNNIILFLYQSNFSHSASILGSGESRRHIDLANEKLAHFGARIVAVSHLGKVFCGVLASKFHEHLARSRMEVCPLGEVVDVVVDDDPQIFVAVVRGHFGAQICAQQPLRRHRRRALKRAQHSSHHAHTGTRQPATPHGVRHGHASARQQHCKKQKKQRSEIKDRCGKKKRKKKKKKSNNTTLEQQSISNNQCLKEAKYNHSLSFTKIRDNNAECAQSIHA